jgi:hypothetical protein
MKRMDPLLRVIGEAPANQLHADMSKKVRCLIGLNDDVIIKELGDIIDECKKKNYGSKFALKILEDTLMVAKNE